MSTANRLAGGNRVTWTGEQTPAIGVVRALTRCVDAQRDASLAVIEHREGVHGGGALVADCSGCADVVTRWQRARAAFVEAFGEIRR